MGNAEDRFAAFCGQLYEACRLPLAIADGEGHYQSIWPELSPEFISRRVVQLLLQDFSLQRRDETHPLILYNEPGFFIGILRLPDSRYCLAGPVGPLPHSREEVLAFCTEAVAPAYLKAYCTLLMNAPLLSLTQMKTLLCLLAQTATGQTISPADVLFCDNTNLRPASAPALGQQLFENREDLKGHVPGDFETAICDAIALGDEPELARRMTFPSQGDNGRMSDNPLHQIRYVFIGFVTLITRAAVRGGLSAETAFSLSDVYCQRMDVMTDPDRIARLLYSSAMDFCHRVKEARADAGHSPLVRQCLSYIAVHLHETLRLDDLAVRYGVSTRTLTSRFRQETGTTIAEYIQAERIREACYLLRHTKYSLSDIAFFLNFSTQSYFIQAFRRHMGCTPHQYRRRG